MHGVAAFRLHLVTLDAVINRKGILALGMADPAGFAFFHVSHGGLGGSGTVRENLGMAIGALVGLQMKIVAENRFSGRFWNFVRNTARFEPFVALVAIAG